VVSESTEEPSDPLGEPCLLTIGFAVWGSVILLNCAQHVFWRESILLDGECELDCMVTSAVHAVFGILLWLPRSCIPPLRLAAPLLFALAVVTVVARIERPPSEIVLAFVINTVSFGVAPVCGRAYVRESQLRAARPKRRHAIESGARDYDDESLYRPPRG